MASGVESLIGSATPSSPAGRPSSGDKHHSLALASEFFGPFAREHDVYGSSSNSVLIAKRYRLVRPPHRPLPSR